MVDPQLKNNQDLSELLFKYEISWEKGKNYFLDQKMTTCLVHFSHILDVTSEKHDAFRSKIECCDAELFLLIPQLLILFHLDKCDKDICLTFYPAIVNSPYYPLL